MEQSVPMRLPWSSCMIFCVALHALLFFMAPLFTALFQDVRSPGKIALQGASRNR
jgi:hypothetical protein